MSKSPVLQDLEEVDIKSELIKHTDGDDSPITLLEKNAENIDENEQEKDIDEDEKEYEGEEVPLGHKGVTFHPPVDGVFLRIRDVL